MRQRSMAKDLTEIVKEILGEDLKDLPQEIADGKDPKDLPHEIADGDVKIPQDIESLKIGDEEGSPIFLFLSFLTIALIASDMEAQIDRVR
ncbi:hypothetical protein U1Q18_002156 [Sarracenia purpurea var. burkii]